MGLSGKATKRHLPGHCERLSGNASVGGDGPVVDGSQSERRRERPSVTANGEGDGLSGA